MKTIKKIFTVAVIGLTIFAGSGVAFARGWGKSDGTGMRNSGQRGGYLMYDEMQTERVKIIAELTKQSEETITSKLENKPVWAVLDEYGAKYADFQVKMSEKRVDLIKQAVIDGKITQTQADRMIERESQRNRGFGNGFRNNRGNRGNRGYRGDCPMY